MSLRVFVVNPICAMNGDDIKSRAETSGGAPPTHWLRETGSTNSDAMHLGEEGAPHGTTVAAEHQTAGRGKLGAKWHMPAGEGVLLSMLLRRMPPGVEFNRLTLQIGEWIAELLHGRTSLEITIKPPNDLLVGGKKLAGILCEARWRGDEMLYAVVGVGINVNVREFPEELRSIATSLAIETKQASDVRALTEELIEFLREKCGAGATQSP